MRAHIVETFFPGTIHLAQVQCASDTCVVSWAKAPVKIARMTLTIKLDRNWSSFQLANSAPPLSVTDSAIAPSARIQTHTGVPQYRIVVGARLFHNEVCVW